MKQEKINKYYLSGKISGLSESTYRHNFKIAKHHVLNNYEREAIIINPLNIKRMFKIKWWIYLMFTDILEQRKCTHSVFQKNWIDSKGSVIEYFLAKFIFKHKIIFI